MPWLTGLTYHVPLCVAANSSWWITQVLAHKCAAFGQSSAFDLLVAICVGGHSLDEIREVRSFEFLPVRHIIKNSNLLSMT